MPHFLTLRNCQKSTFKFFIIFALFLNISCSLEPKYKRPKPEILLEKSDSKNEQIDKISWQNFFQSPELQKIISSALKNNRDLKIAALNIEAAQANYGISKSNLLPTIGATAAKTTQGVPSAFSSFMPSSQYRANLSLASYELDFFGRLRNLKKSALEDFLATKEAFEVIKISIITQSANAYAQYLLDRELLEIAKDSIALQQEKYKLAELRYENQLTSKSDLLNAESEIENAKIAFEAYKNQVELDKNSLKILSGNFNEELLQDKTKLEDLKINEKSLNFIASESLLNRPDIKKAEHDLKNANANIGAARAAFFPSITLTGTYGYSSKKFNGLFASKTWSYTPQINIPIFSGGRNYQNLKLAEITKKSKIISYQQTIEKAFKETLDELSQRETILQKTASTGKILQIRQKNYDLAKMKQKNGLNSKSQTIDEQISLLSAKEKYLTSKKDYLVNLINIYKTLGGGSEAATEVIDAKNEETKK